MDVYLLGSSLTHGYFKHFFFLIPYRVAYMSFRWLRTVLISEYHYLLIVTFVLFDHTISAIIKDEDICSEVVIKIWCRFCDPSATSFK